MTHIQACLGSQQAQIKCQVSDLGSVQRKQSREEEGSEEGPSKQAWGGRVWRPQDGESEGGAELVLQL